MASYIPMRPDWTRPSIARGFPESYDMELLSLESAKMVRVTRFPFILTRFMISSDQKQTIQVADSLLLKDQRFQNPQKMIASMTDFWLSPSMWMLRLPTLSPGILTALIVGPQKGRMIQATTTIKLLKQPEAEVLAPSLIRFGSRSTL